MFILYRYKLFVKYTSGNSPYNIFLFIIFLLFANFNPLFFNLLIFLLTFALVKSLAVTYQGFSVMQENTVFPAIFNALYLAVPDILLTHTHTHTHRRTVANISFIFFRVRAREAHRNLNKQRAFRSSLCSLFYALL